MPKEKLEEVIETRVEPVIDEAVKKFLGVRIEELKGEISDKILTSPLLGLPIHFELPFKQAKEQFKKDFMGKLLQTHHGNVSAVARITGINRRSIHRLVDKKKTKKIRKDLFKPYYLKQQEVENIIDTVLEDYKSVIREEKMEAMYAGVPSLSKDIVDALPDEEVTLKEAEEEFEKRYVQHHLQQGKNLQDVAKKIELRYETLVRKMKKLGI